MSFSSATLSADYSPNTKTIKYSGAVVAKIPLTNDKGDPTDIEVTISKSKSKRNPGKVLGKFAFHNAQDAGKFTQWITTKNIRNDDGSLFNFQGVLVDAVADSNNYPPNKFLLLFKDNINTQVFDEVKPYLITPDYTSDHSTPSDSGSPEFRSIAKDLGKIPGLSIDPTAKLTNAHSIQRSQSQPAFLSLSQEDIYSTMSNKEIFVELRASSQRIDNLFRRIVGNAQHNPDLYREFIKNLPKESMKTILEKTQATAKQNVSSNHTNPSVTTPTSAQQRHHHLFKMNDATTDAERKSSSSLESSNNINKL